MAKMTKNQLIDAIAEGTQVSKGDVKAVIEQMATVGYKELNESGEFVIPGFATMSVVNKPATEARSGVNPFTKGPMGTVSQRPCGVMPAWPFVFYCLTVKIGTLGERPLLAQSGRSHNDDYGMMPGRELFTMRVCRELPCVRRRRRRAGPSA